LNALAGQVQQFGEQKREQEALEEAKQKLEEMKAGALEAFQSGDPDKMAEFAFTNPEYKMASQLYEYGTHKDEETLKNSVDSTFEFIANPTEQNLNRLLTDRNKLLDRKGVPPEQRQETAAALEQFKKDPEAFIKKQQMRAATLDPERYKAIREATGQDTAEDTTDIKNWEKFVTLEGEEKLQFGKAAGFIDADANPSPTDIDDYVADGELCRAGDQAACKRNEDRKGFKRAGPQEQQQVQLAKDAATAANEAINKIPVVEGYINNLYEVDRLIDQGAGTGAIEGRLPSFRSASVELDNLRNQLGLSVIQSATFGPLSEKELRFALDTALPDKLEGPELKKWVKRKIKAQESLLQYLKETAAYLSTPGNTRASWIMYQEKKAEAELPPGVTNSDILFTMDKHNMTRREVLDKLGAK